MKKLIVFTIALSLASCAKVITSIPPYEYQVQELTQAEYELRLRAGELPRKWVIKPSVATY